MDEINTLVATVIQSYISAVFQRDVTAFMRLYDQRVRVYDAWDAWSYEGVEQWQKPIEAWLSAHPDERVKVTFDDVRTWGSRENAVVSALVTYNRMSADGDLLGAIQNRLTWALHAVGATMRIAHEHTSVPVDFQTMKPFLRKKS